MSTGTKIKLTALTRKELANILKRAGSTTVDEASLSADIERGAPVNPDGTMSLVEYAAWLAKEDGRDADA